MKLSKPITTYLIGGPAHGTLWTAEYEMIEVVVKVSPVLQAHGQQSKDMSKTVNLGRHIYRLEQCHLYGQIHWLWVLRHFTAKDRDLAIDSLIDQIGEDVFLNNSQPVRG